MAKAESAERQAHLVADGAAQATAPDDHAPPPCGLARHPGGFAIAMQPIVDLRMRLTRAPLRLAAIVPALLAASVATASAADRLPDDVVPVHYDLTITPDLEAHRFHGTVAIDVEVRRPIDRVVLNARELAIGRA